MVQINNKDVGCRCIISALKMKTGYINRYSISYFIFQFLLNTTTKRYSYKNTDMHDGSSNILDHGAPTNVCESFNFSPSQSLRADRTNVSLWPQNTAIITVITVCVQPYCTTRRSSIYVFFFHLLHYSVLIHFVVKSFFHIVQHFVINNQCNDYFSVIHHCLMGNMIFLHSKLITHGIFAGKNSSVQKQSERNTVF